MIRSVLRAAVFLVASLAVLALTACGPAPGTPPEPAARLPAAPVRLTAAEVARFHAVVARLLPVAERICRRQRTVSDCDFRIVLDTRPGQPANAFQTVDERGRPVLAVTAAMLKAVRNDDELAFVMSHEAAHHIAGHISRQQQGAMAGAILLGGLATLSGADPDSVDAAMDLGATVGARRYSKAFELEADALGTVIAHEAGFDPLRGAAFFERIPDPGNRFLGTHPPNAARIETVRRVAAGL